MTGRRIVLLVLSLLACAPRPPAAGPWTLSLPSGEQLAVLSVRGEHYSDGDVLHLFYRTDTDMKDTLALRARARTIWPAFAPTVISAGYAIAAMTAEHPTIDIGNATIGLHKVHRWGIVARRDDSGVWRLDGDTVALPPPVAEARPIIDSRGVPLRVAPRR